jgi:hypothetical protein
VRLMDCLENSRSAILDRAAAAGRSAPARRGENQERPTGTGGVEIDFAPVQWTRPKLCEPGSILLGG